MSFFIQSLFFAIPIFSLMIIAEWIVARKNGVIIINSSRGGVIDEDELLKNISTAKISAAGLDVFINEPVPNKKILINEKISTSPHIGASTKEAQKRIGIEIAQNIIKFFK